MSGPFSGLLRRRVEFLAQFLEFSHRRFGMHHVVDYSAAGDALSDVREIAPRNAFNVRLAEREFINSLHPFRLKLWVPRPMPTTRLRRIELPAGFVARIGGGARWRTYSSNEKRPA